MKSQREPRETGALFLTLTCNAYAAPKITSKVVIDPVQALTPEEAESLSLAAGKLLSHTDKARTELKAKELDKAKADIEKAITLANIVKAGVPAFNVKTEIAAGDKKYVDETKVKAWLVPLHEELDEIKVLEPIRAAKRDANDARNKAAKEAGKPQPEQLEVRSTLALLDDHPALVGLEKAQKALKENKPEEADKALAELQSDGVLFNYVVAEVPLGKIQADLMAAKTSVKGNHMAEAKSALASASTALENYAKTASAAKKAAAEKMQAEIKQLSTSLNANLTKSQQTIDK
ncbi:MAG: YfdX family protein [Cyanobacteria bacterium SZAS TMP-1]|nr:YfdX family protein [Cyanobacteria bacterium SZAS TMP-1]